ncbi:DUF6470 family protein [Bacillus rubiinfantis]|uniref:DUF6470 family protein n=1 Tax=Bacillus rubiinfantis TaxID=1499680 RepID=UPI0005A740BD|nr:DUF6470 family protein [Bacillus rubiinfantis]
MQLPQIRLQHLNAQIGLRITQPVQEIQQSPADVSIKQVPVQMTINRQPSQLEIDQEEAWNQLGFKSLSTLSAELADYAKQAGLEAIGEIVDEGNQMAAIENKSDAFVAIAVDKGNPPPDDYNIAFIPSYGSVKIHYTPTEQYIEWKQGGAEIDVKQNKPVHTYQPGKVEVYLRQEPTLDIDFVGININKSM